MRIRRLVLLVGLLLNSTGCANCLLHSMVSMFPNAYSGVGGSVNEKQADLDRRLEQYNAR